MLASTSSALVVVFKSTVGIGTAGLLAGKPTASSSGEPIGLIVGIGTAGVLAGKPTASSSGAPISMTVVIVTADLLAG